ncbi:MAG: pseudouridine synthase [Opitutales bacterium]
MDTKRYIGFKAGSLCEDSLRMELLAVQEGGFFVLNKPADIALEAHSSLEVCPTIIGEIRGNLEKNEFKELGITSPYSINYVDKDISGACLIACNKNACADLRNLYGSYLMNFSYLIVTKKSILDDFVEVDLPILTPYAKEQAVVTHRFGKKCKTQFKLLSQEGSFQLWRATTPYARRHQIRLHACEAGLKIVGDTLYSNTPMPSLSDIKRVMKYRTKETMMLYSSIAIHLESITFGEENVEVPYSKSFGTLINKLKLKNGS